MQSLESAVLSIVESVLGCLELEDFYASLLGALREAAPSDWSSLNDIGPGPDFNVIAEPEVPVEMLPVFVRLKHENPLIEHYERTHDARAYRISDFLPPEEWHRRAIYREFYRPLRVEHQIAFTLPTSRERILGVALSREHPDYSDRERDILERARPPLIQIFRNVVTHAQVAQRKADLAHPQARLRRAGLSQRQSEVIALVAQGLPLDEIGWRLQISRRTVEKHIEQSYRALGVASRAAALRAVATLVEPDLDGSRRRAD